MAELALLDEKVNHLYFDAKTMIETIEVLDENQPERYQLLNTLNHAINLITDNVLVDFHLTPQLSRSLFLHQSINDRLFRPATLIQPFVIYVLDSVARLHLLNLTTI